MLTIGVRIRTQINDNVEHGAHHTSNQLSLTMRIQLIVQSTQNTSRRSTKVVLYEGLRKSFRLQVHLIVVFRKIPAFISKNLRLDLQHIRYFARAYLNAHHFHLSVPKFFYEITIPTKQTQLKTSLNHPLLSIRIQNMLRSPPCPTTNHEEPSYALFHTLCR